MEVLGRGPWGWPQAVAKHLDAQSLELVLARGCQELGGKVLANSEGAQIAQVVFLWGVVATRLVSVVSGLLPDDGRSQQAQ